MRKLFDIVNVIVVVLVAVLTREVVSSSRPPVLTQFEVDEYNNVIRPYDRVNKERSEIIVENVGHLRLECRANYPVQWIYTGSGIPIINTDISLSRTLSTTERDTEGLNDQYVASVFLGPLKEQHTGTYHCSRTNNVITTSNLYIYVPGQDFFTTKEGKTIKVNPAVSSTLIPCSVSDPRNKVSLYKLDGRSSFTPVTKSDDAISYDPRKGFRIYLNKVENPEGMYYCRAGYNNTEYRDVFYTIKYKSAAPDAPANYEKFDAPANFKESDEPEKLEGNDFFTTKEGKTIVVNPEVASIFIPCSVTDPRIEVSLYRDDGQMLLRPVTTKDDSITYTPQKGFRVYLREVGKPEGRYHCRAEYNKKYEDVHYTVTYDSAAPAN